MRDERLVVMVAVFVLLGAVSVFAGSYALSNLSDCSGAERAIVERHPHYGNSHIATYPWTFSCNVRYTTKAERREVLGYYGEMLRRNGWEVMGFQAAAGRRFVAGKRPSDLWDLPASAGGVLVARRDGYSYWVSYEPSSREPPDLPDDGALVTVSANDHTPPASRFPE